MPEKSTKPVTEWKSMGSLNRERAASSGNEQATTEWRSMRKIGAFMKRKSSRGQQAKPTQITYGASNSSSTAKQATARKTSETERIKRLESELSQVRKAAQEKVGDLESKVANRDEVIRSRAENLEYLESQLAEAKQESTLLSARVEELETLASKYAQSQNAMAKEIQDRNEVLKIREDEISRVRHENRKRPFEGIIRTVVVGSTGFMFALASSAGGR